MPSTHKEQNTDKPVQPSRSSDRPLHIMAAPLPLSRLQIMPPRPTLQPMVAAPSVAKEDYTVTSVTPLPWLSDIIPYISTPARHSLIAATTELVYSIDSRQMLINDEESDTTRLENIIFSGLNTMYLDEDPGFDPEEDFDSVLEEAREIVGAIDQFISDNIHEVRRPVNAIVDPRHNVSRAEAWILRCSMHPEVIEGNEHVKAIWRSWLDEYHERSADYWELESEEEEEDGSDDFFYTSELRVSFPSGTDDESIDRADFEPLRDVELEPYGPRHKVEDLAELHPTPPKDEKCSICLEEYIGKGKDSPCRRLKICKHYFHGECIDAWINASHERAVSCPNCRTEICAARPRRVKGQQTQA
ncbi:hypothetical protein DE146DRAFT_628232 [Phaeosphaeria sp. MPI-PUGE-AT-0046c]|nr:hypothetical protein DE146DRAFT_628232 [Phaeosphaeria sp. MPI-PUGE-AT-0046c]